MNSSVYIVDMEITGPHLIRPGGKIVIAGEEIYTFISECDYLTSRPGPNIRE